MILIVTMTCIMRWWALLCLSLIKFLFCSAPPIPSPHKKNICVWTVFPVSAWKTLNMVGQSNCFILFKYFIWAAPSEFGTYRLCEQRRFRRACASAQSRQNLRCSLIQAVSQEEPSDRKPDPQPLWMAGHAQLKFVMTECSKTQIRLAGLICSFEYCTTFSQFSVYLTIFIPSCKT